MWQQPVQELYSRLEHPSSFRLMQFDGKTSDGRLRIRMSDFDLNNTPEYTALSYVWDRPYLDEEGHLGPQQNGSPEILCNDIPMPVSVNGFAFLERLYIYHRCSYLWMDAVGCLVICVSTFLLTRAFIDLY